MKKICTIAHLLFIGLLCGGMQLDARVRTVQSRHDFDTQLNRAKLMVVMMYTNKDKNILRMYEKVSSTKKYDDADISFIKINSSMKDADSIAQRYDVGQYPVFFLCENGKAVLDKNGGVAQMVGNGTDSALHEFIHAYFDSFITQAVVDKEDKRQQRVQDSRKESDPYFYPAVMYTPSGDISSWKKPSKR